MKFPRGLIRAWLVVVAFTAFTACAPKAGNPSSYPDTGTVSATDSGGKVSPDSPATDGGPVPDTAIPDTAPPWSPPVFDPKALPTAVPSVEITIADDARAALEKAPFYGSDVTGTFVDGNGKRYEGIDLNYRGAYALVELMQSDPLGRRNWKVKFPSANRYRERREWNYTFSPGLRQLLAYDLMRFAGVRVPSARFVRLVVNGKAQGLYLEYEDPDNKDWLAEMFGDRQGDLYKATSDLPASEGQPEQKVFADTTYLGPDDASYPKHYNKKTNNDTNAADFGALRVFLDKLNNLPDADLAAWLDGHLQVDRFISFMVVSNFIGNWDSFPQRPKNFWLYEVRGEGKMAFIPWDLDGTFQSSRDQFNQMGTKASIFYNLLKNDYSPIHSQEGTERPLARRLIAQAKYKTAYVARYRELAATLLSPSYLTARLDALAGLADPALTDGATKWTAAGSTERAQFKSSLDDMRGFIGARSTAITQELASQP